MKIIQEIEKRENSLREVLDEKIASLHELEVSIDTKLRKVRELEVNVESTTTKTKELVSRQDQLEQYSRRNNIRIMGVKVTPDEDTDKIVYDIAQRMRVKISPCDIDRSHRVHRRKPPTYATATRNNAPTKQDVPPIIVKFILYKSKQMMMKNRRKLKGSRTVIVEDLTVNGFCGWGGVTEIDNTFIVNLSTNF